VRVGEVAKAQKNNFGKNSTTKGLSDEKNECSKNLAIALSC